MVAYLEFEKPVAELEKRIEELRAASEGDDVDISNELQRLELKSVDLLDSLYSSLTPWQKTQVARHPDARISAITWNMRSRNSCRWAAIAIMAMTRRSWVGSRDLTAARSC